MGADQTFERTRRVLADALSARAFPCAVAEVGGSGGARWTHAAGRLTFADEAADATRDTVFDLASLTKVLATTTIALMQMHEQRLRLDARLEERVAQWTAPDRVGVTIRDLFEHCSGLPAHKQYFRAISGRLEYQRAICAEPLAYAPRTQAIYSDPGFILLGFVLEDTGAETLDVQFARWRDTAGIVAPITYRPPPSWRACTAPTEVDPWRGRLLVGEVDDENAAALDGVAAHAGLFGTAGAVGACARWWLSLLSGTAANCATPEAALTFAARSTVPGSSRALGWDTMLPTSSCGTRMSPRAIGHTGFTGTSLWIDPAQDLYAVLLTNRVHPTRANDAIQPVRRAFHDAVIADLRDFS
jgi:CubicO group peptidase (beta-lactamase class C family)